MCDIYGFTVFHRRLTVLQLGSQQKTVKMTVKKRAAGMSAKKTLKDNGYFSQ
jgi:hypothetical protein